MASDPDALPTRVRSDELDCALEALRAAAMVIGRRFGLQHTSVWARVSRATGEAACPPAAGVRAAATTSTTPTEKCCKSSPRRAERNVARHAGDPYRSGNSQTGLAHPAWRSAAVTDASATRRPAGYGPPAVQASPGRRGAPEFVACRFAGLRQQSRRARRLRCKRPHPLREGAKRRLRVWLLQSNPNARQHVLAFAHLGIDLRRIWVESVYMH